MNKEVEKLNSQDRNLEEAFQLVLDVPDFQMWLHGEIPERIPLKLIKNEFVSDQYDLKKFGERVRIVD
ncbi:hypothetical protein [Salinimicrobium marinum]|nr:hypothetical protein [Salinimicrobium marinum]